MATTTRRFRGLFGTEIVAAALALSIASADKRRCGQEGPEAGLSRNAAEDRLRTSGVANRTRPGVLVGAVLGLTGAGGGILPCLRWSSVWGGPCSKRRRWL